MRLRQGRTGLSCADRTADTGVVSTGGANGFGSYLSSEFVVKRELSLSWNGGLGRSRETRDCRNSIPEGRVQLGHIGVVEQIERLSDNIQLSAPYTDGLENAQVEIDICRSPQAFARECWWTRRERIDMREIRVSSCLRVRRSSAINAQDWSNFDVGEGADERVCAGTGCARIVSIANWEIPKRAHHKPMALIVERHGSFRCCLIGVLWLLVEVRRIIERLRIGIAGQQFELLGHATIQRERKPVIG